MRKKSQISIFIILAIVLLITFGLLFFIKSSADKSDIRIPTDFSKEAFDLYINSCLKNSAKRGILEIGLRGGYFNLPALSTANLPVKTAIYYKNGKNHAPNIAMIENELKKFIDLDLYFCGAFLESIYAKQYDFDFKEPNSSITIHGNDIDMLVKFPIKISKKNGEESLSIEDFYYRKQDTRIRTILEISNELVELNIQDPENICLDCLLELGKSNNFDIDLEYLSDEVILFILNDLENEFEHEEYIWQFANEYDIA